MSEIWQVCQARSILKACYHYLYDLIPQIHGLVSLLRPCDIVSFVTCLYPEITWYHFLSVSLTQLYLFHTSKHLPIHSTSTGSSFMPQWYVTRETDYIDKRRQMICVHHVVHCSSLVRVSPESFSCPSEPFSSFFSLPMQTRDRGSGPYYQFFVDRGRVTAVEE
jgi:hypothetical protein